MDADERRRRIDKVTETVIGAAYEVSNVLGVGFLERVYENALVHELRKRGLQAGFKSTSNGRSTSGTTTFSWASMSLT